jgi:hypothetical protein
MLVDIDYFKQINDRYEHLTGDEVVRQLSQMFLPFSAQRLSLTSGWGRAAWGRTKKVFCFRGRWKIQIPFSPSFPTHLAWEQRSAKSDPDKIRRETC